MTMGYAEVLSAVADSHARLLATLDALTDDQARGDSLLPGWSRGHVATHLARNADALNRFAVGVLSGTPGEMYPGGPEARAAAIEEGAGRPAGLIAADVRFAGGRVIENLGRIPEELLDTPVRWRKPVTARGVPVLRWRELEIHHVDLGLGYTVADWPEDFVESTLAAELPALTEHAPEVDVPGLPGAELLAWLIGRPTRGGLPELPSWPF
ncbi:maleylpyruvate isomerase family mycothiol-dependent enzyme [Rhodococcus sp. D2-41]|uniref:Maleylpyruvate isomerase family mycothiol-dependent enzyme n=1 Tax=Speluncibacter jeojiensis TaxID=2710754 RepID=A0A9X4RFA9_9ACTN|nr:maleylpyruvate isomerase family mycothiol-dependent enzyme [Rhodococcus sp. D2-41]MDG3008912.1 maleylpyruvate isomerase family mycothiol-dependent enzyme [Rhodococcus sp. D2-41]MDG3016534.1 maleylpyruvate isomerase family mycothiol-dependent enzyme [Corynebacteriales bacterium D3-21]